MMSNNNCTVRPMNEGDLELVLVWRNSPEVRSFMLTRHEITSAEHRAWFEKSRADASRALLIAEKEGGPFGFVGFSGVSKAGAADWGFYTAPEAARGAGRHLGAAALEYAFHSLALHKVCGQVLGFNAASIRFHRSLGFQQEGVLRQQHQIDGTYHDLICFGLLRQEWCCNTVSADDE
jgi:UDP-4-amino-4,6-dideoxy-N-acetyl-beta-L-altrosamine N-acetyltransferase